MTMPTTTTAPTLDQRRARHAYEAVKSFAASHVKEKNGKQELDAAARKYATHAKKLPSRIIASGLGQALAFLNAKGYAPELMQALADWILQKRDNPTGKKVVAADELLLAIVERDCDFLRRATDESLAYLQWINRWVEAILGEADVED